MIRHTAIACRQKRQGTDLCLLFAPLIAGVAFVIFARLFRENSVCERILNHRPRSASKHPADGQRSRFD